LEDVPTIAAFIIDRLEEDLDDFNAFSTIFNPAYIASVRGKIDICKDLISSSSVAKELKSVTQKISDDSGRLRVKLNALEGYLKLAATELDITVTDVGIKTVRNAITRGNTEGVTANIRQLLAAVKRNSTVLETKGLNPDLLSEIETQTQEIETLNVKQNDLISTRNRLTEKNTETFNDLWKSLQPIMETAKAIYRGVNPTKLKDYTVLQLQKRINA
jgi:hypothetical protein